MSDTVALSFPRDSRYYAVARLVVGGMAAPLQMSYDALDDLQLAISSLLDHEDLATQGADNSTGDLGNVQLRLEVDEHRLVAAIGSFTTGSLDRAFERSAQQGGEMGLQRLLDTIVDEVTVTGEAEGEWITLTKQVKALA
jgi:anti-sigma regulatory factor (Ser/Thr protein kinase)